MKWIKYLAIVAALGAGYVVAKLQDAHDVSVVVAADVELKRADAELKAGDKELNNYGDWLRREDQELKHANAILVSADDRLKAAAAKYCGMPVSY